MVCSVWVHIEKLFTLLAQNFWPQGYWCSEAHARVVEFKRNVKAKLSKVRSIWIWSKLMFRRLLNHAKLPNCLWGEALITANYLQNRIISSCVPNTPFEMWENKKTDISNLQIFCSTTYALIPKEKLKKLDNRSQKLVFIGFDEN